MKYLTNLTNFPFKNTQICFSCKKEIDIDNEPHKTWECPKCNLIFFVHNNCRDQCPICQGNNLKPFDYDILKYDILY